MTESDPTRDRHAEIAAGLDDVRSRMAEAATTVGRDPQRVTLVVVTKTFPSSDIAILAALGVRDVAENRHQDAARKVAELAGLDVRWHFVGQIQSNKAARIAEYADVVHSVDSSRVAARLGAGAEDRGRVVTCLVQVNLDPDTTAEVRGGVPESALTALADVVASTPGLRLGGLMGVAPLGVPAEPAFARLAAMSHELCLRHPTATVISAGMSGDFAAAIRAGATHVRVGSAVLGRRPPLG
jgi:pyridoxal phosphate enzyme (YggS family)